MRDHPKIVALIAAHNEAASIGQTVEAVRLIESVERVIVIDDGSHDGTGDVAETAGAKVIRSYANVGKGAALNAGAKLCEDADIVILLDGDLGTSAGEAIKLIAPVVAGQADMAIATFPPAGKAGFGLVKGAARRAIANADADFSADAPLSGQRALTRSCLDACLPFASGYGAEVILTIRALKAGFRVIEVPTTMSHNETGRDLSGFIHRGRQFVHVHIALFKERFR